MKSDNKAAISDRVILASQSPRRKELLAQMGVDFEVVPSEFEEHLEDSRSPEVVAIELALGKANWVAERYPDSFVIGSDTIVTIDGTQLEKPHDLTEARIMLARLADRPNDVTTSVVIVRKSDGFQMVDSDTTRVYFKPYDVAAIETYVASRDPLDKADAYGIQSGAAPLISYVEGAYDTLVGLPTHLLAPMLYKLGISAHAVKLTCPVPQNSYI